MGAESVSGAFQWALTGAGAGAAVGGPLGAIIGGVGGAIFGGTTGAMQSDARRSEENQARRQLKKAKRLAGEQYTLNVKALDERVQGDDTGQLTGLLSQAKNSSLTMDQKLALIDKEVKAGLGTESARLAMEARTVAVRENDLYGETGAAAIQRQEFQTEQRALSGQITSAKESIQSAQEQRDAGLAEGTNVAAALGLGGLGVEAQQTAQAAGANRVIAQGVREAGWDIDGAPIVATSQFDNAVSAALMGTNINQDRFNTSLASFESSFKSNEVAYQNALLGLEVNTTGLISGDANNRQSARIARDNLQLSFDQQDYEISKSEAYDSSSAWLTGAVSGLATGVGGFTQSYNAGLGFNKWWGDTFKSPASGAPFA